jgi:hypothetical protein
MTFSFQSEDEGSYFSEISKGLIRQIKYAINFWQSKAETASLLLLNNISSFVTHIVLQSGFLHNTKILNLL